MKNLVSTAIIAASVSFNAFAAPLIDRNTFVESLDAETCASPKQIFIDTQATNFDYATALSLAWVALQTLDDDPNSRDDDPDADLAYAKDVWQLKDVEMFNNKRWNVRAMIADYDDATILTFRHTDSNLNWLLNADYGLWKFDKSFGLEENIHHGFGTMLGSVWADLVAELKVRSSQGKKVIVTGHSLGGALALLAAPGLKVEGIDLAYVYATGAPKVASVAWSTKALELLGETPVFRISNRDDLFAKIPLHNESLDDFADLFPFIPPFISNAIGMLRTRGSYGLIGDDMHMVDGQYSNQVSLMDSLDYEKTYWENLAGRFKAIDESKPGPIENAKQKFAIIQENLSTHLMRAEEIGYTCSMINILKSEG